MMKAIFKTGVITAILLVMTGLTAMSQDFPPWPVPDDKAAVENPLNADNTALEKGMALYNLQCKACHGEKGLGDGLIKAANFTAEGFLMQSDGAIFYKIRTGRSQMPGFKALGDEEIWSVIHYIRSLSSPPEGLVKKDAFIDLSFNETANVKEIMIKVTEQDEEGNKVPAEGVKVNIGVKRYFGILPITPEAVYSDKNGMVTIPYTEDISGDEQGTVTIVAAIEGMKYNPAEVSETVSWGKPKATYWTERRALWKDNEHVPVWLLTSFIGGALTIWGFILYVLLLLRKIHISGKQAG